MEKQSFDIVALVHRIFTDGKRKKGGFDKILEHFSKTGKKILLIEQPLYGLKESTGQNWSEMIVSTVENGRIREIEKKRIYRSENNLRWFFEIIFNIFYIKNNVAGKPVLFSADPLNSLTGVFYFFKFSKKYFHSIDFYKKRFQNIFLDLIYRISVLLTIKMFDNISVVSLRAKKELIQMGCPAKKIYYLPNSPVFKVVKIPRKKRNILIYTSGWITEKYNYDFVIELIYRLKNEYKDIRLLAVGGKNTDPEYFKRIYQKVIDKDLKNNIDFVGFIDRDDLPDYYTKARIGFSFYSDSVTFYTYYADSLKTREYALYGIPTVADGNISTDEEIVKEKCGFVVKNVNEAAEKTKLLLRNDRLYLNLSKNCLAWAKKTDKKKLLENLSLRIFS